MSARARVSVIVPVWNGASVITDCLDAVYSAAGTTLHEVICVDNASTDDSAALIAARFPHARLLRQAINLGFGGGVNVGLRASVGDVLVLLNQDCTPEAGWLDALIAGLDTFPRAGIAGCTLLNAEGAVDHAGARVTRPLAMGEHLTDVSGGSRAMDYVTGAIFAITRPAYAAVGDFDEGFFPAYYEESDYCYRARAKGIATIYVPGARGRHLRSSREWARHGIRHAANGHRSRYRFILKHFCDDELRAFFDAEVDAARGEVHYDQAVGRAIAARDVAQRMDDIAVSRQRDLGLDMPMARRRMIETGCATVFTSSVARAQTLAECDDARLALWEEQTAGLMRRILLRDPRAGDESMIARAVRELIKHPVSVVSGRESRLQSQLNDVHVARHAAVQRRLKLLETLAKYDV